MGKYMRKPKLTGDTVAVIGVSPSTLGVRTRAKTLALQKLQQASNSTTVTPPSPAPEHHRELCYLQLCSRRLEKPPVQKLATCCRRQNPNPNFVNTSGEEAEESDCFGENNVDFNGRERSTRESTPCSSIKDINVISTPGSSTRPRNRETSNRITQNYVTRSMPLALEIEEFFAHHDQEQQRRFADKYNFDIMNENPLEGRYEWVRLESQIRKAFASSE